MRDKAQLEANKLIEGANVKRNAILAEYEKFVREKKAFLVKLRTILESELTITVQMIDDAPKIDETIRKIPPVEKPAPVEKVQPIEEEHVESNIVDVATKPVAEEKEIVSDDTKTYAPVKPSSKPGKGAAK